MACNAAQWRLQREPDHADQWAATQNDDPRPGPAIEDILQMQGVTNSELLAPVILAVSTGMFFAMVRTGWMRLRPDHGPNFLSPLSIALRVTTTGLVVGTWMIGISLALSLVPSDFVIPSAMTQMMRPEIVAGVALGLLILFLDSDVPRSWLLSGSAIAAGTTWVGLWALQVVGIDFALGLSAAPLSSAVFSALLMSPSPAALALSRVHRRALAALEDHVILIDSDDNIVDMSKAGRATLGLEKRSANPNRRPEKLPNAIRQFLDGSNTKARLRTPAGRILEVRAAEIGERRRLKRVRAIVVRDFTGEHRGERRLLQLAHYDSLTGLANRRLFLESLTRILEPENGVVMRGALYYLDLDGFKSINDTLGHAAGDELLKTLAERLRVALVPEKIGRFCVGSESRLVVARLAGDEFAIIAPSTQDREAVGELGQYVIDTLRRPINLTDRTITPSVSIGIALFPEGASEVEALLHQADSALYVAKSRGRQRYVFYEGSFDANVDRARHVEEGLRGAINRNELRLHYQPKLNAQTGELTGFEALLRWRSHELGDVGPTEFIPVAEERGLISELGTWCIEETCRQLRSWADAGLRIVPVAVNVSSPQFAESDLQRVVSGALKRHEIDPQYLELELTESLLLDEGDTVVEVLRDLRSIGVKIALDDFGTGYSALSYLNRFNLDVLKIDRSLLRDIDTNPSALGIASAVVSMAHSLGLSVVAEGIDMEEQLSLLGEMGCDHIQGFLYAPGLPADDVAPFMGVVGETPASYGPGMTIVKSGEVISSSFEVKDTEPSSAREQATAVASANATSVGGCVLLIDDEDGSLENVSERLDKIGIDVYHAKSLTDARNYFEQERESIRFVGVPPTHDAHALRSLITEWRSAATEKQNFVVIGDVPDDAVRGDLRDLGITWALWTPFNDTELRYVVSSSMAPRDANVARGEVRIPVDLIANVWSGGRREVAVVSSISPRGAFIELSEPLRKGSSVRVEMDLAGDQFRGFARVAYVQADDPQRPYQPSGVGVTFYGTDKEEDLLLRKAIIEVEKRYRP